MADKYANQGFINLVPTLNALSFAELATFVSVFEKKAFLIHRVEYAPATTSILEFDSEVDSMVFGLCTNNTWSIPTLGEPAIFDFNSVVTSLTGAGVSSHLVHTPWVKDLSTVAGGGMLVPSRPIYFWMKSEGWAAAGAMGCRIYFTVVDLKAEEYWELVEATRLIGS